jgi:hypothetical protein
MAPGARGRGILEAEQNRYSRAGRPASITSGLYRAGPLARYGLSMQGFVMVAHASNCLGAGYRSLDLRFR